MTLSPNSLRHLLNFYPPYIGAGVKVEYISDDWRELHVSMKLRWYNRNIIGTHFGGSLYTMIDPHFMLLLMQLLGKGYLIWDKAADIEFIKASKEEVTAVFKISDAELNDIKANTDSGEKYFPIFQVEIRDKNNYLVAKATKTIYVKKKPAKPTL
jgi:acyl-coenzyme A thioesterase PaaI-like protein